MLDRERILAKLDELEGYVGELRQIVPASFAEYMDKQEKSGPVSDSSNCRSNA